MVVIQRPVKGARISSFYPVHELPAITSLDSAFQLQEYISLVIRLNVHDVETIVSIPGKNDLHERDSSDGSPEKESAEKESKSEVTVDESCWIYEQLRRLAQDLSHPLITTLQQECTRQTCPEMKAGEWLYLCVAHGNEGAMEQCCAIDYILHTLDSATALLNSPRAFPSRLSIPPTSTRHFPSLARRLGRIFAHAYYHHREAFEQAEAESSLYARFLALTSRFNLVPMEFLVIPPRMTVHTTTTREADDGEGSPDGEDGDSSADIDDFSRQLPGQDRRWLQPAATVTEKTRGISPPGPADDARNVSPRKGRSRTDTMVHSEAASAVEELSRASALRIDPEEVGPLPAYSDQTEEPQVSAEEAESQAPHVDEEQPAEQPAEQLESEPESEPEKKEEDLSTGENSTETPQEDMLREEQVEAPAEPEEPEAQETQAHISHEEVDVTEAAAAPPAQEPIDPVLAAETVSEVTVTEPETETGEEEEEEEEEEEAEEEEAAHRGDEYDNLALYDEQSHPEADPPEDRMSIDAGSP